MIARVRFTAGSAHRDACPGARSGERPAGVRAQAGFRCGETPLRNLGERIEKGGARRRDGGVRGKAEVGPAFGGPGRRGKPQGAPIPAPPGH